jgi:hypothetical protein
LVAAEALTPTLSLRATRFTHFARASFSTLAGLSAKHVLAIQDTSALRVDEKGLGLSFHPVIAVDASEGTVLGLVDNFFLMRRRTRPAQATGV